MDNRHRFEDPHYWYDNSEVSYIVGFTEWLKTGRNPFHLVKTISPTQNHSAELDALKQPVPHELHGDLETQKTIQEVNERNLQLYRSSFSITEKKLYFKTLPQTPKINDNPAKVGDEVFNSYHLQHTIRKTLEFLLKRRQEAFARGESVVHQTYIFHASQCGEGHNHAITFACNTRGEILLVNALAGYEAWESAGIKGFRGAFHKFEIPSNEQTIFILSTNTTPHFRQNGVDCGPISAITQCAIDPEQSFQTQFPILIQHLKKTLPQTQVFRTEHAKIKSFNLDYAQLTSPEYQNTVKQNFKEFIYQIHACQLFPKATQTTAHSNTVDITSSHSKDVNRNQFFLASTTHSSHENSHLRDASKPKKQLQFNPCITQFEKRIQIIQKILSRDADFYLEKNQDEHFYLCLSHTKEKLCLLKSDGIELQNNDNSKTLYQKIIELASILIELQSDSSEHIDLLHFSDPEKEFFMNTLKAQFQDSIVSQFEFPKIQFNTPKLKPIWDQKIKKFSEFLSKEYPDLLFQKENDQVFALRTKDGNTLCHLTQTGIDCLRKNYSANEFDAFIHLVRIIHDVTQNTDIQLKHFSTLGRMDFQSALDRYSGQAFISNFKFLEQSMTNENHRPEKKF